MLIHMAMVMMVAGNDRKQQQQQHLEEHQQQQQQQQQQQEQRSSETSILSNETVIAAAAQPEQQSNHTTPAAGESGQLVEKVADSDEFESATSSYDRNNGNRLKSLLLTWIPFIKASESSCSSNAHHFRQQKSNLSLMQLARSFFSQKFSTNCNDWRHNQQHLAESGSHSAPVTPIKRWRPSHTTTGAANSRGFRAEGSASGAPFNHLPLKPSVRFQEDEATPQLRRHHSHGFGETNLGGPWHSAPTTSEPPASGTHDSPEFCSAAAAANAEGCKVDWRSASAESGDDKQAGECPMDSGHFRRYGYNLVDYISNYLDTIRERRVTPLNIEPGYLKTLIQADAPEKGEPFAKIMRDFEAHIMCGITHWQHPHFHAYFPAGNAYPSILADMLGDALGCVGFSWAASPAYTELEIIMLDWMGKMIGLPEEFLCLSGAQDGSKGGGVIQGSASECVLVNLLAARHWAIERLRNKYPDTPDCLLLGKLIGYCSKEAHSCVEKAAMIGFIRMRALDTDEHHSLRGETLAAAMQLDRQQGLEPFLVCATLGTTSCCSFDNLQELGEVCRTQEEGEIWLHVDAAYAGSALICPEFKYIMRGIEMASSFNMNPNKWLLINFDCSLMWVKDRFKLTRAFVVDPLYLQHSFSDQAIDYRHWGIPLSRRFRALKLWFVIRNYGIEGLQSYIRNHVRLAKLFEELVRADSRFQITNRVDLGLVCFRLQGSNALNQRLLSMINASGKLHMVPASLKGRYVIRFCVCDQRAEEKDIHYAYKCIAEFATELFESIRQGRERIRAISQQNTIDVSSLSLHRQQSTSADRLGGSQASAPAQPQSHSGAGAGDPLTGQQVPEAEAASGPADCGWQRATGAKSPLMKQVSVQANATLDEQDELASLDGFEYDLDELDEAAGNELGDRHDDDDDDDDSAWSAAEAQREHQLEERAAGAGSGAAASPGVAWQSLDCRSPVARRLEAREAQEQDEAEDEVFTLAERRNRMSLRYKREFFVRVVSDPRVYRASISGDINAHASCCSLSGNSGQPAQKRHGASAAPAAAPPPPATAGSTASGSADELQPASLATSCSESNNTSNKA